MPAVCLLALLCIPQIVGNGGLTYRFGRCFFCTEVSIGDPQPRRSVKNQIVGDDDPASHGKYTEKSNFVTDGVGQWACSRRKYNLYGGKISV